MQFVNPAHQRQIVGRDRPGQIIHAAPADPENLRLSAHRQVIVPVDHRFALGKSPALPRQKISFQRQLPDLGVQRFHIDRGRVSSRRQRPRQPFREAAISSRDLVWMYIELFGSSASVFSPLIAAKAAFALKAGLWFRRSLFVMLSPVHGSRRRVQAEFPLIQVVQISRASSVSA